MKSRLLGVGGIALTLVMAGCGETSDPNKLLTDSLAALKAAKSVHMKGTVTSGTSQVTIDADIAGKGVFDGDITIDGTKFHITSTGGTTYIKGKDLWAKFGGDAAAAAFGDSCVSVPASAPGAGQIATGIGQITDLSTLADKLNSPGNVTLGTDTTINGTAAKTIQFGDGTVYVAASGTPNLLEMKSTTQGTIDFTNYNGVGAITAPTGCLDYAALAGGGGTPTPSS